MNGTNSSAKYYDMVVIGSGAAGHHRAIQAAKLGKGSGSTDRRISASPRLTRFGCSRVLDVGHSLRDLDGNNVGCSCLGT